ncbi:MAG: hypothetical protein KC469_13550 [Flavobacteriaceae bacterium]|nr:hypothetical protein [Flavobacteriaceae bacterium]
MKNTILLLTIFVIMLSCNAIAQDINTIFNNKLTLDSQLSRQTKALDGLMAAYGEVQTKVYKFEGTFEEAFDNMKAPNNADVGQVTNQPLGNNYSMYILMTENLVPKPMSDDWYEQAAQKINDLSGKMGKSASITIRAPGIQNPENYGVGDKVEIRMISLSSPYIDLDNFKVIEGTWVSDIVASTVITQQMLDTDSDDFEDEWEEENADLDMVLPKGAQLVRFDDVADTELLQGDVNYVVEISTDQAISFFKNNSGRFMNSFEQSPLGSEDGVMMTTFYLLKHKGELKPGDDVISITMLPAPKSLLSDVLGRNQGTWTLISVNRWTEEDY